MIWWSRMYFCAALGNFIFSFSRICNALLSLLWTQFSRRPESTHSYRTIYNEKQVACCWQHKSCIPGAACMNFVGMFPFSSVFLYKLGVCLSVWNASYFFTYRSVLFSLFLSNSVCTYNYYVFNYYAYMISVPSRLHLILENYIWIYIYKVGLYEIHCYCPI